MILSLSKLELVVPDIPEVINLDVSLGDQIEANFSSSEAPSRVILSLDSGNVSDMDLSWTHGILLRQNDVGDALRLYLEGTVTSAVLETDFGEPDIINLKLGDWSPETEWIYLNDLKHKVAKLVRAFNSVREIPTKFGIPHNEKPSDIKSNMTYEKAVNNFVKRYVGYHTKKRDQTDKILKGACWEMGLLNAKVEEIDKEWGRTKRGHYYKNVKHDVFVSLSDLGKEFVGMQNPGLETYRDESLITSIPFSRDEIDLYLEKILPKFDFESKFVQELREIEGKFNTTDLKHKFNELYLPWLFENHPGSYKNLSDNILNCSNCSHPHQSDDQNSCSDSDCDCIKYEFSNYTRINALAIVNRLIELGICKKAPGKKTGPYEITDAWK